MAWDDPTDWEILKTGLNTRPELLSPWALMYFSKEIAIPALHVYGDSSIIINWVNGKATLYPSIWMPGASILSNSKLTFTR